MHSLLAPGLQTSDRWCVYYSTPSFLLFPPHPFVLSILDPRSSRSSQTDKPFFLLPEKFKKEYTYNIRHAYGDVGGDANRRGKGYTPYSCQKLLTEAAPSSGQSHGCPYRTFSPENLIALLQGTGVSDREVLKGVREDVAKQRFHIACNRVFEAGHKNELKKVKDGNLWPASELDTILHPNTYFKRSFLLKNLGKVQSGDLGVDVPSSAE